MKNLSLNTVLLVSFIVGFSPQVAYQRTIPAQVRANVMPPSSDDDAWFTWLMAVLSVLCIAALVCHYGHVAQTGTI
jgi:hypothetical protein